MRRTTKTKHHAGPRKFVRRPATSTKAPATVLETANTDLTPDKYRAFQDCIRRGELPVPSSSSSWDVVPLSQLRSLLTQYELGKPSIRPFATRDQCLDLLKAAELSPPAPIPQLDFTTSSSHSIQFIAIASPHPLLFVANENDLSCIWIKDNVSFHLGSATTASLFKTNSLAPPPPLPPPPPPPLSLLPPPPSLPIVAVASGGESKEEAIAHPHLRDASARLFWAEKLPYSAKQPMRLPQPAAVSTAIDWNKALFRSSVWPLPAVMEHDLPVWEWEQVPSCLVCKRITTCCVCPPSSSSASASSASSALKPAGSLIRGMAWDSIRKTLVVLYGHSVWRFFFGPFSSAAAPSIVRVETSGVAEHAGCKDGVASVARFAYPTAVAVDLRGRGEIWVVDSANHRIRKIDQHNIVSTTPIECAVESHGIVVDHSDRIWVSHAFDHTVHCHSNSKPIMYGARHEGDLSDDVFEAALFQNPMGLAVDASDCIYVADQCNARIRKIDPKHGMVRTVLDPYLPPLQNGFPAEARCSGVRNIAIDTSSFQIFAAFSGNRRCSRIFPMSTAFALMAACQFGRTPMEHCPNAVASVLQFLIYGPLNWKEMSSAVAAEAIALWSEKVRERQQIQRAKMQMRSQMCLAADDDKTATGT